MLAWKGTGVLRETTLAELALEVYASTRGTAGAPDETGQA